MGKKGMGKKENHQPPCNTWKLVLLLFVIWKAVKFPLPCITREKEDSEMILRFQLGANAANLEVRVMAWGTPSNQATIRTILIAAAVRICCKWTLTNPV